MNRREMIIVGVVLLFSFVGGVFATPALQQVYVTNFPPNQQVTVTNFPQPTNPTTQTGSMDIKVYDVNPAITGTLNGGYICSGNCATPSNFTVAFAFSPKGHLQTNIILLQLTFYALNNPTVPLSVRLNGNSATMVPATYGSVTATITQL